MKKTKSKMVIKTTKQKYTEYFDNFTDAIINLDPNDKNCLDNVPRYLTKYFHHDLFERYKFTDEMLNILSDCETTKNSNGQPLCYIAMRLGNYYLNEAIIMVMMKLQNDRIMSETDNNGSNLFVGCFQGNMTYKVPIHVRFDCMKMYTHNYPNIATKLFDERNTYGASGKDYVINIWNGMFSDVKNIRVVDKFNIPTVFDDDKDMSSIIRKLMKNDMPAIYKKCNQKIRGIEKNIPTNKSFEQIKIKYKYCKKIVNALNTLL